MTTLTFADLCAQFDKPISEAAEALSICCTVLKKQSRKLGIKRWPHRKIKSITAMIDSLEAIEPASSTEQSQLQMEIDSLKSKREYLVMNPNVSYKSVVSKNTISACNNRIARAQAGGRLKAEELSNARARSLPRRAGKKRKRAYSDDEEEEEEEDADEIYYRLGEEDSDEDVVRTQLRAKRRLVSPSPSAAPAASSPETVTSVITAAPSHFTRTSIKHEPHVMNVSPPKELVDDAVAALGIISAYHPRYSKQQAPQYFPTIASYQHFAPRPRVAPTTTTTTTRTTTVTVEQNPEDILMMMPYLKFQRLFDSTQSPKSPEVPSRDSMLPAKKRRKVYEIIGKQRNSPTVEMSDTASSVAALSSAQSKHNAIIHDPTASMSSPSLMNAKQDQEIQNLLLGLHA